MQCCVTGLLTAHASEDNKHSFKSSENINPTNQHHIPQNLIPINSGMQTINHTVYTAVLKINDTKDTKMER
jgi:hypothetical protein